MLALLILPSRSPGSSARPGASSRTPPKICRSERKLSPRVPAVFGSVSAGNTAAGGVCQPRTVKQRRHLARVLCAPTYRCVVFRAGAGPQATHTSGGPPLSPGAKDPLPDGRTTDRNSSLTPPDFPSAKKALRILYFRIKGAIIALLRKQEDFQ